MSFLSLVSISNDRLLKLLSNGASAYEDRRWSQNKRCWHLSHTKETFKQLKGLFFYFTDIEENILEVACNSFITLDQKNNAVDHKPID